MCEPYVAIIIASYSEQTGCDLMIVEGTLESGNETNTWCTVGPLVLHVHGVQPGSELQPAQLPVSMRKGLA